MRILIIEDDRETSQFLQKALKESGHAADLAHDGEDGLASARDGGYDLLIVDRMMPRLDGLAVVKALRDDGVRTPVLFLSAPSSGAKFPGLHQTAAHHQVLLVKSGSLELGITVVGKAEE